MCVRCQSSTSWISALFLSSSCLSVWCLQDPADEGTTRSSDKLRGPQEELVSHISTSISVGDTDAVFFIEMKVNKYGLSK